MSMGPSISKKTTRKKKPPSNNEWVRQAFDDLKEKDSPLAKYLKMLTQAFGEDLEFPNKDFHRSLSFLSEEFNISIPEHHKVGQAVTFTSNYKIPDYLIPNQNPSTLKVTPKTITSVGETFGPLQAKEMIELAALDKSMLKNGIILENCDNYQATLISLAVKEHNKNLPKSQQLHINKGAPFLGKNNKEAKEHWKKFDSKNLEFAGESHASPQPSFQQKTTTKTENSPENNSTKYLPLPPSEHYEDSTRVKFKNLEEHVETRKLLTSQNFHLPAPTEDSKQTTENTALPDMQDYTPPTLENIEEKRITPNQAFKNIKYFYKPKNLDGAIHIPPQGNYNATIYALALTAFNKENGTRFSFSMPKTEELKPNGEAIKDWKEFQKNSIPTLTELVQPIKPIEKTKIKPSDEDLPPQLPPSPKTKKGANHTDLQYINPHFATVALVVLPFIGMDAYKITHGNSSPIVPIEKNKNTIQTSEHNIIDTKTINVIKKDSAPKTSHETFTFHEPLARYKHISSDFGMRIHPITGEKKMHKGIDYAAKKGTPILAAECGKVSFRGRQSGYGRTIEIDHTKCNGEDHINNKTLYAHLSNFNIHAQKGDDVKKGQIIGYVGSSGETTGTHLHFEVAENGKPVDPSKFSYASENTENTLKVATLKPAAHKHQ